MTILTKIGNSRGVRIPKTIIDQARLDDRNLEFKVMDDGLLIRPVQKPRQGWKKQFDKAIQLQEPFDSDQEWLDAPLLGHEDWEW
ncbi:AbrB family transcriptional regulator [Candidatus Desulfarcum epimagneticum]|uniref:AbrB family transcriptional regulator n=1 Tax=uncultured Desulfobacteraceae bacterium TaxID=218296 RepID=A0A484HH81_9BACT|nr:AbrB family transcriptional regulator [uncultured Desulfobacteraceae bacterium]